MSDKSQNLDALLRALDGDPGCSAGEAIVDLYVELELNGQDPALTFPGMAIHLRCCPACRQDHDGVLEAARLFGSADPS